MVLEQFQGNERYRTDVHGYSSCLGQYMVFQGEVYAIKACSAEDILVTIQIYLYLLENQVAIKVEYYISLKLICHLSLVKLVWVLTHRGVRGNGIKTQLAGMGLQHLFIRPDPVCSRS